MTAVGIWTLTLAGAFTLWLIIGGRLAARGGISGYFTSDRTFSPWTVAFCITGLFSGSSYIAIIELSYRTGISSLWYGVAETTQIILIALLLVKSLRRKLVVTVTGIIGERFGPAAQAVGAIITGLTFPMYSLGTAIAFASALTVITDLSLLTSIAITAVVLLAFLIGGGMRAVAFSQTMNVVAITAMFAVALWALFADPGPAALLRIPAEHPDLVDPAGAGISLIVAWFGTFIINVPLAQAAFQMSLSARTPEDGQKGLFLAATIGAPLIIVGTVLGTVASVLVPSTAPPLTAIAQYITGALPAWAAAVFFLGLWACALGWAGPCQFSGATSLGRDLWSVIRPRATQEELVLATRVFLVFLTGLLVLFGLIRAENAAWWNITAWTLRNGATFAPVLAAFFWPVATRSGALAALLTGFGAGLGWHALSGFSATDFTLGTHPVWVGMIANLTALVVVSLATSRWQVTTDLVRRRETSGWLLGAVALIALLLTTREWLAGHGLIGLGLFLVVLALFVAVLRGTVLQAPVTQGSADDVPQSQADRSAPLLVRG